MSSAVMAAKPRAWDDVLKAGLRVTALTKAWVLAPSPRPAIKTVLHTPLVAFWIELRAALRTVDWKRVGVYAGAAAGALLVLLLAVVTVADLTDDLKPARPAQTASGDSYTNAIVARSHAGKTPATRRAASPVEQVQPVQPVQHVPAAPVADLEFSTDATPTPATRSAAKASPAPSAKAKKKPAKPEVFIP
jgi:hypothetical protein